MMRETKPKKYPGIYNDKNGGMTDTGKIIRASWVFGIIPETETCENWLPQGIQGLWDKTNDEWEKYGFLVSNLPPELREKFERIQKEALENAKKAGWDPDAEINRF